MFLLPLGIQYPLYIVFIIPVFGGFASVDSRDTNFTRAVEYFYSHKVQFSSEEGIITHPGRATWVRYYDWECADLRRPRTGLLQIRAANLLGAAVNLPGCVPPPGLDRYCGDPERTRCKFAPRICLVSLRSSPQQTRLHQNLVFRHV